MVPKNLRLSTSHVFTVGSPIEVNYVKELNSSRAELLSWNLKSGKVELNLFYET
jgi:hypothetical protein